MASTEQRDKLKEYLLKQQERRARMDSPEYQDSVARSAGAAANADSRNALAATLMDSAAKAGTLGGKQADASPVAQFADRQAKANAGYQGRMLGEDEAREKRYGVDARVYEYLADKEQKGEENEAAAKYRSDTLAQSRESDAEKRKREVAQAAVDQANKDREYALKKEEIAVKAGPSGASDIEKKAAGYYERALAADKSADDLITKGYDPTTTGAAARSFASQIPVVGHLAKGDGDADYKQVKDEFITSVLRPESGASISDQEYSREDTKYFPQPGDTKEVVAQKSLSRKRKIAELKTQSGKAEGSVQHIASPSREPLVGSGEAAAAGGQKSLDEMSVEELRAYVASGGSLE